MIGARLRTPRPDAPASARRVAHVMGMPISLALRGRHSDDARAESAWIDVVGSLREADLVFSTYRPDSCISRLDRGQLTLADCPPEVGQVLDLAEQARVASEGAFDVWRAGGLDPSAVVKGWAVQRAAAFLDELPHTDYCLSAGGDMTCRAAADAEPWRIGIEDPHDPTRIIAVVPLRGGGIATSGTAHRGRHLLDARTGRPPAGVASVTVIADTLTWADIDATAAYARGVDAARWLATRPGRSGLVVWPDGRTTLVGTPA